MRYSWTRRCAGGSRRRAQSRIRDRGRTASRPRTRVLGQAGLTEAFDDGAEEERRYLEVEDGCRGALDRSSDALAGGRVGEVATHVGEPFREAIENLLVELLSGPLDRFAGAFSQLVVGPVVDGDADDRAVEEPARFEPVERAEGHHLRQVARDSEHDEDVRGLRARVGCPRPLRRGSRDRAGSACHLPPPGSVPRR